jgi:hypothetical protein
MPGWEKSLTVGILFLTFSLTLFDISPSGWVIRDTALGFFVLSTLFLIKVLSDVVVALGAVLRSKPATTPAQASAVQRSTSLGPRIWELLRPVMLLAFLLGYGLALGRGTAQMERKSLESSVVVVGIIWFFLVCLAEPAVSLAVAFPQKVNRKAGLIIAAISLVLLIYGIVIASTAADHQGFLHGTYLALFGFAIPIAVCARRALARYSPF